MGLLKKIKASSITETIVATTIIVIVFSISIFSINTILEQRIESNTHHIEQKMREYIYTNQYTKKRLPDNFSEGNWIVSISKEQKEGTDFLVLEATHKKSQKKIVKSIIYHEN